jgi:hypothetical protein
MGLSLRTFQQVLRPHPSAPIALSPPLSPHLPRRYPQLTSSFLAPIPPGPLEDVSWVLTWPPMERARHVHVINKGSPASLPLELVLHPRVSVTHMPNQVRYHDL